MPFARKEETMSHDDEAPMRLRWARMRFSIISHLLASPPEPGELAARIAELAQKPWRHPAKGTEIRLSPKTIERMYYTARGEDDPLGALARKIPKHAGTHPRITPAVAAVLENQYRDHGGWTWQLHHDNLVALAKHDPALCPVPSYTTVRRFMKDRGMRRIRKRRHGRAAEPVGVPRETRSYELSYVNALWHFDFHDGKRQVVTPSGELRTPVLFGLLDDCSRVCCHAQWYLDAESSENLVHGLSQGIQKRGLPRGVYSDRGGAMTAAETREGLERLGIVQYLTLPSSPQQNGKQEHFWTLVEGRLMPMLEGEPALTLELLNTATQAWVEQEYHRTLHSELKKTPLERYLEGPDVSRKSPDSEALRRAFRMEVTRTQRLSDGTVSVEGVRFEVPSAYRTLVHLRLRVVRWNLSNVHLVDPRSGDHLATLYPLDKARNAERARRALAEVGAPAPARKPAGIAPLLRELMAEYAATGLPPAYLPKNPKPEEDA
jgi:transposase InsO family protein